MSVYPVVMTAAECDEIRGFVLASLRSTENVMRIESSPTLHLRDQSPASAVPISTRDLLAQSRGYASTSASGSKRRSALQLRSAFEWGSGLERREPSKWSDPLERAPLHFTSFSTTNGGNSNRTTPAFSSDR